MVGNGRYDSTIAVMQTRVGNGRSLSKSAAMGYGVETAVINPIAVMQTRVGNGRYLSKSAVMGGWGGNGRYESSSSGAGKSW